MNEAALLAALAERPEDEATWLVYADWLEEQGGERHHFVRLLLELARGLPEQADRRRVCQPLKRLQRELDPAWREQVVRLRAALPLRFRVESCGVYGPAVPGRAMFDRNFTLLSGFLEQGTLRHGAEMRVHFRDGTSILDRVPALFGRTTHEDLSAGQTPFRFDLYWDRQRPDLVREPLLVTGPADQP